MPARPLFIRTRTAETKANSTRTYFEYTEVLTRPMLWPLLAIITSSIDRKVKKAVTIRNSRKFHLLIKSTGPRKTRVTMVIRESDGPQIYSPENWLEKIRDPFSCANTIADLPLIFAWITMQIGISFPSKQEVTREIVIRQLTPMDCSRPSSRVVARC